LGMLNTIENNFDEAERNYLKAIEIFDRNLVGYLGLAKIAMDKGELEKAKKYYTKVLFIDEKNIFSYMRLVLIAHKNGNYQEVESLFKKAIQSVRGDYIRVLDVNVMFGRWYVQQKMPEKFLDLAKEFFDKNIDQKQSYFLLAEAQEANGQISKAEETLKKAVKQGGEAIDTRFILAKLIEKQKNRQDDVLELLNEIQTINPKSSELLEIKARYQLRKKLYKQASITSKQAISLFPYSSLGYQIQGDVFNAQEMPVKSIDAYKKAYKLEKSIRFVEAVIKVMVQNKQATDALGWLNELLLSDKDNTELHLQLAMLNGHQKRNKMAVKYYQKVLKQDPRNVVALNNLAMIYLRMGNNKAIDVAKKAFENASEIVEIVDTYGYILVKKGMIKKGMKLLESAQQKKPKAMGIQLHLAEAYLLLDMQDEGIGLLKRIVQISKNKEILVEAEGLLKKYR